MYNDLNCDSISYCAKILNIHISIYINIYVYYIYTHIYICIIKLYLYKALYNIYKSVSNDKLFLHLTVKYYKMEKFTDYYYYCARNGWGNILHKASV